MARRREYAEIRRGTGLKAHMHVTVPREILEYVDELADLHYQTRSAVVAEILGHDMRARQEAEARSAANAEYQL